MLAKYLQSTPAVALPAAPHHRVGAEGLRSDQQKVSHRLEGCRQQAVKHSSHKSSTSFGSNTGGAQPQGLLLFLLI